LDEKEKLRRANDYLMFFMDDLCEYDFSRMDDEDIESWAKRIYMKSSSLKTLGEECRQSIMMLSCCDQGALQ
jgi:hypothetical protein